MENSAYAPNPLPPPALVVFSQAGTLPEALRMQRPFNTQAQETKDIQVPFNTAGFGLRLMDSYPGLPAHLLHHLQPQFHLHPALDPRSVPFAPAFQPITSESNKVFPSAFAPPPAKCLKMESGDNNSEMFYQRDRAESSSPASASISPPPPQTSVNTKEEVDHNTLEERDTATPSSEVTERSTPEEGRGFRHGAESLPRRPAFQIYAFSRTLCKKKFQPDPSCCPVCGVTLRSGELDSHFVQELERLYKLGVGGGGTAGGGAAATRPRRISSPHHISSTDGSLEARWETYQRVRANRQGRLRIKYRKRKPDEISCPVCNEPIQGSLEEVNHHVESCLRKNGSMAEEDENVDVEGEGNSEVYEEYEWAGQRRIRASTLLVGGFAGAGMATTTRAAGEEDEGDLVVDEDDSATFGPSQYTEADVVVPSCDGSVEEKEREALREAVISPSGNVRPTNFDHQSCRLNVKEEPDCARGDEAKTEGDQSQVFEALKRRIRDLESESKGLSEEKFLCLICMEHYKKPVISVCCWHVHCEECWLHTLGAKKLCPQCNMITSPSDLRRIYL